MDATEKSKTQIDLYLLKGGAETDDYASRRLTCSEATWVSASSKWWKKKSTVVLDITSARLNLPLLIPKRWYRKESDDGKVKTVDYSYLQDYWIHNGYLTLTFL